jgi:DNA (cytosine-5)-methyltransferase 1
MRVYYNEVDSFCCGWLSNLMDVGLITPGVIDDRSILDVRSCDLAGYARVHFFAGIGVWDAALRAQGWPDDREIWTGSCPCQPLSGAGLRKGHADERHLWPAFHRLVAECRPAIVAGEQVASADGREWLSAVRADLEALGYAVGAADLCAAGAGAPHIRQRLYWVADATGERQQSGHASSDHRGGKLVEGPAARGDRGNDGATGIMADADEGQRGRLADSEGRELHGEKTGRQQGYGLVESGGATDWDWIACRDGKSRPTQPGLFPLVDAWPTGNRVAILRAAGNAIHFETARQFVNAISETL